MVNMTAGALQQSIGRYVETVAGGEVVRAYVPPPLPPEPALEITLFVNLLNAAERALGRLDGVTILLPSHELFLYMYVRKEAVLSSQIEGTQSTLADLLRFESEAQAGEPIDDIREVSNYVDAMMYGLERMRDLPLSLRLIRELHDRLLQSGRGASKDPGEFRRSQNWIGGTRPGNARFIPPPVQELMPALGALENFLHEDVSRLPPLIKAALVHVQFETIHPFLDGNGRVGRLLITLYLCQEKVVNQPLLYLSLYLKTHRAEYYRLLQEVRESGVWTGWLTFFLEGVAETANQAFQAAMRIVDLFDADRELIATQQDGVGSLLRVHKLLQRSPMISAAGLKQKTELTLPTINRALANLEGMGIVREMTGKRRGKVYAYTRYLAILEEGTTPLHV